MSTTIQIQGRLFWRLVFEYDNSTNSGTISQSYTTKEYNESTRSTFLETVSQTTINTKESIGVSAEAGASYGPVSAKVSSTFESSKEVNDMLYHATKFAGSDVKKTETEAVRNYNVGPNSKLNLYQQSFEAPGLSAAFDVYSTNPGRANQSETIDIEVVIETIEFISNLKVAYTDDLSSAPSGRVREIHGGNADINDGFGGKYVWLIPEYTSDAVDAAIGFDLVVQDDVDERYSDITKGAGGPMRYIIPVIEGREKLKVTEVALYRSGYDRPSLKQVQGWGWSGFSENLNANRMSSIAMLGESLYVLWKTTYAY